MQITGLKELLTIPCPNFCSMIRDVVLTGWNSTARLAVILLIIQLPVLFVMKPGATPHRGPALQPAPITIGLQTDGPPGGGHRNGAAGGSRSAT